MAGQNGGEAWRKLCRRFSGKTRGKRLHLIRKCENPTRAKKLNEVTGIVEKWEMNIRRLEADFKEVFSNGLESGILVEMMPSDVAEYLSQKISDSDQHEEVKEVILQKGKGKGVEIYGYCNSCGAWGHRAVDCPGKTSMRCFHCGQNGHRLSECPVKDTELKGKGKGKFGKGNNKGKGQFKGSDFKGSGKMGSFSNYGYTWNGGYKGGKNAGKGWSANGVREEDVWEDVSGAQTMQLLGVTEDHEEVMYNAWTKVTTASAFAGRKDRVVPSAPQGLQLQNRFGELVVEEEDNDEEDGIPIMALFSPETEINHLTQGPRWVKLETVMDSGDAESVVPVQMAPWVPRQESEGSKRGQTYLSASGEKLRNVGEKKFDMVTSEGNWAQATFQVAEVSRPLCSVYPVERCSLHSSKPSTSLLR